MAFQINQYSFSTGQHNGKEVIWIHFPKDRNLINHLKENVKAQWSNSNKQWYVADGAQHRKLFGMPEKVFGKGVFSKIHPVNQPEFIRFQELLALKAYSPNTVRTYCMEFAQLLYVIKRYPVTELSAEQLRSYCLYCMKKQKLSENQMHSRLNALKFYFEQVLHREKFFFDIPRPKKPLLLPKVLNTKEVKKLFSVTENKKHLLMLKLCYGMGLRVSEIVNLKIADIDSKRMQVLISAAKGKKDRYVHLPETVLNELRSYYISYQPPGPYLFEGKVGSSYSKRGAQAIFKSAMKKAGIKKNIGIHGLRHSYATHLLEYGTDISFIQKLLGHKDIRTTLLYTNVADTKISAIQSPLDKLNT